MMAKKLMKKVALNSLMNNPHFKAYTDHTLYPKCHTPKNTKWESCESIWIHTEHI